MKKIYLIYFLIPTILLSSCESITHKNELNSLKTENIQLKNTIVKIKQDTNTKKTTECISLYDKFKEKYSWEENYTANYTKIETKNIFYSEKNNTCIVWYTIEDRWINIDSNLLNYKQYKVWKDSRQVKNILFIDDLNSQQNLYQWLYYIKDKEIAIDKYNKIIQELK